jgi:hypothetical protein
MYKEVISLTKNSDMNSVQNFYWSTDHLRHTVSLNGIRSRTIL